MSRTPAPLLLCVAASLLLCSSDARAGGPGISSYVIYVTRLGGDPQMAKPYLEKFSAYLEESAGWPKGSASGSFFVRRAQAIDAIKRNKPGFGLLEPPLYFELRESEELQAIGQLESKELVTGKLHLVTKDPALTSLEQLQGKALWTTLAEYPAYLSNVVLEGKVDVTKHFALKRVGTAFKGVRGVIRGEAAATLLDDEQLASARKMAGGAELRSILSSRTLPSIPVVIFGGNVTAAQHKTLNRYLLGLCSSPKGAPICKELRIEKIVPADKRRFEAAQKLYDRK